MHYNPGMPVQRIYPGQKVTGEKLERAKRMRREMTRAEKLLWTELHANKQGVHFRRQQIIAGFIVDFYCHAASLVIEVDGDVHSKPEQQAQDGQRDEALKEMGLKVIRFQNSEVEERLPNVLARIRDLLKA